MTEEACRGGRANKMVVAAANVFRTSVGGGAGHDCEYRQRVCITPQEQLGRHLEPPHAGPGASPSGVGEGFGVSGLYAKAS